MATTVLGRKVGDPAQAAPEDNGRLMTGTVLEGAPQLGAPLG